MRVFTYIGYATVGYSLYRAYKLWKLLNSDCDSATAACKLPKDAYKGKVCWITGASSGVGHGLAKELARQGAKLILSSRQESVLQDIKQQLPLPPSDIYILPLDLGDYASHSKKVQLAVKAFGHVDVLLNCGGVSHRSSAWESSFDLELRITNIDYLGQVSLSKQLLPYLSDQNSGHYINISSVAGKSGVPMRTAYCGAKAAFLGWFEALRWEVVGFGYDIKITNVCLGSVNTNIAKNSLDSTGMSITNIEIEDKNELGMTVERSVTLILGAAHAGLWEAWLWAAPFLKDPRGPGAAEMCSFYFYTYYADSLYQNYCRGHSKKFMIAMTKNSKSSDTLAGTA